MSNLQVPDPGLLAKLELYVADQCNWSSGVMLDLKVVCKDGIFYWSSLLIASLSPFVANLIMGSDEEKVLILPDVEQQTSKVLLKRLLQADSVVFNKFEKQFLALLGVDDQYWKSKVSATQLVQIKGVEPANVTQNSISPLIDSLDSDVDILWKDDIHDDFYQDKDISTHQLAAHRTVSDKEQSFTGKKKLTSKSEAQKPKKSSNGRKMYCKLCSLSFQSQPYADYQDHINSHKNSQGLYACNQPNCDRLFRAWCHLSDHVYSHGNLPKPHLCSYCNYTSTTRANIRKHEVAVHEDPERRDFSCDKCTKKFKTSSNLYEHMRVHDTEYRHSCPICKKDFKSWVGYNQHLRLHSGDLFDCSVCGEKFQSKHSVTRHEKDIHGIFTMPEGSKTFKCGKKSCLAEFNSEEDYRFHIKSAHQNKAGLFICHLCKKICSNSMTLKSHFKKMHQGDVDNLEKHGRKKSLLKVENPKPRGPGASGHVCECCDKRFKLKYQLLSHLSLKQRNGLYCVVEGCPNSDQIFPSVESLELHLQDHTGEVSYPCMLCFKYFTTAAARDKHLSTHEDGNGGYHCPHCDVIQPSRIVFNMHVKHCSMKEEADRGMIPLEQELSSDFTQSEYKALDGSKFVCQDCGIVMHSIEDVPIHQCLRKRTPSSEDLNSNQKITKFFEKFDPVLGSQDPQEKNMIIGKEPFKCSYCEKILSSSHGLKRHMLTHHDEQSQNISKKKNNGGISPAIMPNCTETLIGMTGSNDSLQDFTKENNTWGNKLKEDDFVETKAEEDLILVVNTPCKGQLSETGGAVTVYQVGEETVEMEEQDMVLSLQKDEMIVYQMNEV